MTEVRPAPAEAGRSTALIDDSDKQLAEMGYQRWTRRRLDGFANVAISAAIISTPTGIFSLYGYTMNAGGPAVAFWGWAAVWLGTLIVGAAMAEIAAVMATSGAMYYWSYKLGNRWFSWITAHLNLIGLVAGTAAVDYAAAVFLEALFALQFNYTATPALTFGIFTAFLLLHALLNSYANQILAVLNKIAVWWICLGVVAIAGVLIAVPTHHESVSFALGHVVNGTGFRHLSYAMALGLGMGLYTFCGYDASIHVAEETTYASTNAPRGIMRSILISGIAGFVLLFGLNFAVQNYSAEAGAANPPAQILIDALGAGTAKLLLLIVLGSMLLCGLAGMTASSRQCFATSRDRVLPGWKHWRKVHEASGVPRAAVWFSASLSFILALPVYWNTTVFNAIASINVVGVFTAYTIPVALRLWNRKRFNPNPGWNLGRWGTIVSAVAVVWVGALDVLACLPQYTPINAHTFNYTPVALLTVVVLSQIWWFATARKSFTGPVADVTAEYLAQFTELV